MTLIFLVFVLMYGASKSMKKVYSIERVIEGKRGGFKNGHSARCTCCIDSFSVVNTPGNKHEACMTLPLKKRHIAGC